MSYSLGQVPAALAPTGIGSQIAATAAAVTQQVAKNRIIVPADCSAIRSTGDEFTSFDAAKELRAGEWYTWGIPLAQTLTPAQAATLAAAFEGAFFPAASGYPVNITTPCESALRNDLADKCNREPKDRYVPHKQDNAVTAIKVQKHNDPANQGRAKHYISLIHQFTANGLDGKRFFPVYPGFVGYRNVDGSPMFLVTFQLNPSPKVDLYDTAGNISSGNVARGALPVIKSITAQRWFVSSLKRAAAIAGIGGSLLFGDNPMNAIVRLNKIRVELHLLGSTKRAMRAGSSPNPLAPPETTVTEIRPLPQDYRLNKEQLEIFDSAIDQAATAINKSISLFASLIGALFAQINVLSRTNSYVRVAYAKAQTITGRMNAGGAAIEEAAPFVAQAKAQAKGQLENPNHYLALRAIQEMRRQVARKIQDLSSADQYLAQTAAGLAELAVAARDSDVLIRKGLDDAIARARQHTGMHASIRRSMECAAIRKARREQETYPERLGRMAEILAAGATSWASKRPQADAALRAYRELDAYLAEIERQIPLAWWAKPLGPLPVWGWGAVGVGTFFGGAFMVRRSRKKKKLAATK